MSAKMIFYTYPEIHTLVKNSVHLLEGLNLDCMVAIGGGGFIPGRMIRTYTKLPLYSVSMKLYNDSDVHGSEPVIFQWLDSHAKDDIRGKNILIVDEIDDTRITLEHCVRKCQCC